MIISFLGCPCSGKTTVATKLFIRLKEAAIPCELVPEQARWYIAQYRKDNLIPYTAPVYLNDIDQRQIMSKQIDAELLMGPTVGRHGVLVCDSSALNALLYMTDDCLQNPDIQAAARQTVANTDIFLICPPVPSLARDVNRLHNKEQSLLINKKLPEVLGTYLADKKTKYLTGDSEERTRTAMRALMEGLLAD